MARRENKSKADKINKSKEKESMREGRDYYLESGDNPEERERTSGTPRK